MQILPQLDPADEGMVPPRDLLRVYASLLPEDERAVRSYAVQRQENANRGGGRGQEYPHLDMLLHGCRSCLGEEEGRSQQEDDDLADIKVQTEHDHASAMRDKDTTQVFSCLCAAGEDYLISRAGDLTKGPRRHFTGRGQEPAVEWKPLAAPAAPG